MLSKLVLLFSFDSNKYPYAIIINQYKNVQSCTGDEHHLPLAALQFAIKRCWCCCWQWKSNICCTSWQRFFLLLLCISAICWTLLAGGHAMLLLLLLLKRHPIRNWHNAFDVSLCICPLGASVSFPNHGRHVLHTPAAFLGHWLKTHSHKIQLNCCTPGRMSGEKRVHKIWFLLSTAFIIIRVLVRCAQRKCNMKWNMIQCNLCSHTELTVFYFIFCEQKMLAHAKWKLCSCLFLSQEIISIQRWYHIVLRSFFFCAIAFWRNCARASSCICNWATDKIVTRDSNHHH